MYVSTLNKIWSQEHTGQIDDICPGNSGALVPTVFDNSWFINAICFHSSVWGSDSLSSVENPGIKLVLWGITF